MKFISLITGTCLAIQTVGMAQESSIIPAEVWKQLATVSRAAQKEIDGSGARGPSRDFSAQNLYIARHFVMPMTLPTIASLGHPVAKYAIAPDQAGKSWEKGATRMLRALVRDEFLPGDEELRRQTFKDVPIKTVREPFDEGKIPVDFVRVSGSKGDLLVQADLLWKWFGITLFDRSLPAPTTPPTVEEVRRLHERHFQVPNEGVATIPSPALDFRIIRTDGNVVSAILFLREPGTENKKDPRFWSQVASPPIWDPVASYGIVTDGRFVHLCTAPWTTTGALPNGAITLRFSFW